MHKIVFATNNEHKLNEVRLLLADRYQVVGLKEIGCDEEIPETADTLEGNASQKAKFVWERFHLDCFADDTGLEVEALNGAPGVISARYAGPQRSATDNMAKLLGHLKGNPNRRARFRTVISLIIGNHEHLFEGVVDGHITEEITGSNGFGYDPVFMPENHLITFAQMDMHEKNRLSHRARAVQKLIEYLNQR